MSKMKTAKKGRKITRIIRIDKGIYEINDSSCTYRFLERNLQWEKLNADENEKNKKSINGYTRTFRNGKKKIYIRAKHP